MLETLLASAALDRRRVAQDLHDDTVQVLSAVTVELELLRRRGGEHADWLGRLRDHLQSANERIRDMVADLDPGRRCAPPSVPPCRSGCSGRRSRRACSSPWSTG
ncbi:MAG: histidine kinase [Acidimicrobiales bacterium]